MCVVFMLSSIVVHMCACGHTSSECMWRSEVNTGYLPQSLSTLLFETGSLPEPEAHRLPSLAGLRDPSTHLSLSLLYWGYRCMLLYPVFYVGAQGSNSGPHHCAANVLLTELPP